MRKRENEEMNELQRNSTVDRYVSFVSLAKLILILKVFAHALRREFQTVSISSLGPEP